MQNINVLFEDENLLVLDKPAGITVNRSDTTIKEETLQDWVGERLGSVSGGPAAPSSRPTSSLPLRPLRSLDGTPSSRVTPSETDYEQSNREAFYKRAGIVHRLDKETSGIILVAKTEDAFVELLRQFREREVEKTYTALVHGKITPQEGEISVPVGRLPWNKKRFGIVAGGRDATTGYKVLHYKRMKNEPLTLLELKPKTGRTHQIRVHLKYLNHPIFADELYGGRKTAREDRKLLNRQFLHASGIKFTHPVTHKKLAFTSPLPLELTQLLSAMQDF